MKLDYEPLSIPASLGNKEEREKARCPGEFIPITSRLCSLHTRAHAVLSNFENTELVFFKGKKLSKDWPIQLLQLGSVKHNPQKGKSTVNFLF